MCPRALDPYAELCRIQAIERHRKFEKGSCILKKVAYDDVLKSCHWFLIAGFGVFFFAFCLMILFFCTAFLCTDARGQSSLVSCPDNSVQMAMARVKQMTAVTIKVTDIACKCDAEDACVRYVLFSCYHVPVPLVPWDAGLDPALTWPATETSQHTLCNSTPTAEEHIVITAHTISLINSNCHLSGPAIRPASSRTAASLATGSGGC